ERDGVTGRVRGDRSHKLVDRVHALAVDGRDQVAGLQPGLGGRPARYDRRLLTPARAGRGRLGDRRAARDGRVKAYADVGVLGLAGRDDPVGDPHIAARRCREADARVRSLTLTIGVVGLDLVVEPDHLAVRVDQGATRIAGVDGRIGLDRVRDRE